MEKVAKRIYLHSYDHELLDQMTSKIVEVIKKEGGNFSGPMPLPTKIKKYTVLRSVHVNKDSREQFEMRIHRRFIEIKEAKNSVLNALSSISLPAGISVEIK